MLNPVDLNGKPFHFIGIGGIGMSALAYVLAKRNLPVSGSDLHLNDVMKRLQQQGAQIFLGQQAENLEYYRSPETRNSKPGNGAIAPSVSSNPASHLTTGSVLPPQIEPAHLPQVICSTAINPNNPEYQAALALGCSVFHRSDLLAALMHQYQGIAVAGTHGKTTTSSMIGYLLYKAGLDPTIVVGGEVNAWGGNARVGQGPHLVAEADESDGSLVKLKSHIGIITNIELDHPDHYATLEEVIQTFEAFAANCHTLIGCIDSDAVQSRLTPQITYSLHPEADADYWADQIVHHVDGTTGRIWERGTLLGHLRLTLLGRHNVSNALAAIAVGRQLGLAFEQIADILSTFEGARRRFERRGEYHRILFVDDYGHHPSELQATIGAARLKIDAPDSCHQRLVAVFQPHRYSRTLTFLDEFAESFGDADLVVTTDIYSAGEANPGTISGGHLAEAIAHNHPHAVYQPELSDVLDYLKHTLTSGDLVLFLGAGSLNRVIPELMAHFQTLEDDCPVAVSSIG